MAEDSGAALTTVHGVQAGPSALSMALVTGRALLLLQLLSRALTFLLNQALVRLSTPEVFGTASIQFDLVSSTILFLSREGVRNALLRRQDSATTKQRTTPDQLSSVPFYAGWVIAAAVVGVYLATLSSSTTSQLHFHTALALYVAAALVELSIEPLYVRSLVSTPPKIHVRVQAEGGQAIVKAVVSFICLYVSPRTALLGFAIGQLAGAVALISRYIAQYGLGHLPLFSSLFSSQPRPTDAETKSLALANARQSLVKHVLTEADRIAVGRISPLSEQGGYAIAINYGSLIARILFQPIEETLHLHFSSQQNQDAESATALLVFVVRLSAYLVIFLPAFVPPVLPVLLHVLLPERYKETSAPKTLETYLSFYIPLLSLNGILEAFHTATATPRQMGIQARWMILSSAAFVGSLFVLSNLLANEQALVVSSCISMLARIFYAFRHAQTVTGISLQSVLPHPIMLVGLAGPGTFLRSLRNKGQWESSWPKWAEFMGWTTIGGLLMLGILQVLWRLEQGRLSSLQTLLTRRK